MAGVEVSSIGAGLPLIVVGIAAIAIGGGGAIRGDSVGGIFGGDGEGGDSADQTTPAGQTTAVLECPDLPRTRITDVPQGITGLIIVAPAESKTEPFTIRFKDNNQTVGALTARLLPSWVFEIQSFVDADCQSSQIVSNEPGGAALDAIPNNTNVRIPDLMGRSYTLNLGTGGPDIPVNVLEVRPR